MASKIRLVPLVAVSVALWVWILLNWREVLWFWFGVIIQWAFGMVGFALLGGLLFALVIVVVLVWGAGANIMDRLHRRDRSTRG